MSREVRRVPLDFNFPMGKTWPGFLTPERLEEDPCTECDETGYSYYARHQRERWYGNHPFHPSDTNSPVLTPETPAVRAVAERHVSDSRWFYGQGEEAIVREATRLCKLWNSMWCHHLTQWDVDALLAAGRLMDFTHTWTRETKWQPIEPAPVVTAAQVNTWSLSGMGHDAINCGIVIKASCERAGVPVTCEVCDGHGSLEAYPGQRAEQDDWKPTDPPTGEGYQLWQTVSEGGPCSPVFSTPEGLADWIIHNGSKFDGKGTPREELIQWVANGGVSVGTFTIDNGVWKSGVEAAARRDDVSSTMDSGD